MRKNVLGRRLARWGAAAVWAVSIGIAPASAEDPAQDPRAAATVAAAAEDAGTRSTPAAGSPAAGDAGLVGEIVLKGRRGTRTDSLEAREVRERGARDLGEALSALPAVEKVRKGGIANDVVLRGMKKDDVAVTIDGAKVHGACPSRMDPPAFHLDYAEVDVVQVRRGPFDVTQAGGLAGGVDVRTRRGRPGVGTELHVEGGGAGRFAASATGSFGAQGVDVLVGGAYKEASPYLSGDGRSFTEVPAGPARYRDRSDGQQAYRIGSGFARLGWAPAGGQRLEVGYTRQSAPRVLYPYLKMDGVADDTDRVTARWSADAIGPLSATVQGYWSRVGHDMTDAWRCSGAMDPALCSGSLARGWSMGTFARSDVWGGQAEVRGGDAATAVAFKGGADFYVRGWDNRTERVMNRAMGMYSSEASIPDVTIRGAGLYAEARRSLGAAGATRLTAGARIDVARSEANVDRTALYGRYHSGRDLALRRDDVLVGGNVQLERDLAAGVTGWAGYGHGTRLPDPQERYIALSGMMGNPDWVGRPGLRPVQSDELDAGVTWRAPRLTVKAQAFHAWYADFVNLTQAAAGMTTARTYENVSARMFGGEATGRIALPAHLYAGASAAFTRGIDDSAGGTSLAEIPPLKATLSLRWDDGRFFAEVEQAWAARQGFVDGSLQEQATPAWWTTGLKAGATFSGVKVFAVVQNLFDRFYVEHLSYQRDPFAQGIKVPEPGRSVVVAAQYAR